MVTLQFEKVLMEWVELEKKGKVRSNHFQFKKRLETEIYPKKLIHHLVVGKSIHPESGRVRWGREKDNILLVTGSLWAFENTKRLLPEWLCKTLRHD